MNRRRLCQLTAATLTSDLTTHNYVCGFYEVTQRLSCWPNSMDARVAMTSWEI